jgi:hypothetical protein
MVGSDFACGIIKLNEMPEILAARDESKHPKAERNDLTQKVSDFKLE